MVARLPSPASATRSAVVDRATHLPCPRQYTANERDCKRDHKQKRDVLFNGGVNSPLRALRTGKPPTAVSSVAASPALLRFSAARATTARQSRNASSGV